ncbi:5'/3'-nucleotidase SurE [Fervidibacillus halotolerans]|uniref:5'-nucleotidase SurE n=1 Tax=Fervidibacillus halotolerans TaxID=2980027 RepID=A0A9E8M036_9BACI|nr:5'/3'-nucleotidase SurE [Fervidibacillus halotolerans]WAA12769.1 5'/3'-nucleotidase SurE [Fervidibacillus halotolerans]
MNIFVTNDDGIFSPGVKALVEVLHHFGDVYVVCPDGERSAIGHSITLRAPLKMKPVDIFPNAKGAWSVNGTPADCVKLGMEVLLSTPPDIVFSAINLGPNLGRDLYYSGTLAGAVEASLYNVPAVSVSLNEFDETKVNYNSIKQLLYKVVEVILQNRIPKGIFLNINLPNIPVYLCKGVKIVPLDLTVSRYRFVGLNDPHGRKYFWLKDEMNHLVDLHENSDYLKLKEGYITVTPVEFPVHHKRKMEQIERWFRNCAPDFIKHMEGNGNA